VSHFGKKLQREGRSAAGWSMGGSVIAAVQTVQSPIGQWVATNCAVLPTASAGQ